MDYCDKWVTKRDKRRTASVLYIPRQKKGRKKKKEEKRKERKKKKKKITGFLAR